MKRVSRGCELRVRRTTTLADFEASLFRETMGSGRRPRGGITSSLFVANWHGLNANIARSHCCVSCDRGAVHLPASDELHRGCEQFEAYEGDALTMKKEACGNTS